ncbi:MAG TPA: PDZ domain-containing protein [Acidimicrobiales bacterium]|nr:PDZ domain-containing protein [Acidimicrobiales bacterium]
MEGSGPFNFGDFQDDPDDSAEDDRLQPTWLPPEDRLWRHPSEVARHGHPQGVPGEDRVPVRAARRDRRFAVTASVVGVAAVATAVVVAFTVTSPPGSPTATSAGAPARTASLVTDPMAPGITAPLVVRMVQALRPSLISIGATHGGRSAHMTGIVLAGGDLAVTSAAAVGQAKRVDIVTSAGQRRRVRVLGSDPHSGIAVVGTGGGLTPAPFADGDVQPGELAIAACLCGSTAVAAAGGATAAVGEVRTVGTAATLSGGTGLVDTIEADMPLGPAPLGGVLLNPQGQVVGILDAREGTTAGRMGVFVPADLAVSVAHALATTRTVDHGWLGIKCTDAPDDGGARITAIMAGSPAAAAGLRQGDVVEAVDTHPVISLADLQASLYTSPPGTPVSLMLVRSGQDMMTTMTLAGSPTN